MSATRGPRALRAVDLVEAAYRLDGTEAQWLNCLLELAQADLDTGAGVYAFTGHEDLPNYAEAPTFAQRGLDPGFAARLLELNRDAPSAVYELLRTRLVTCGGLEQVLGVSSPSVQHFRALMEPIGIRDGFCLFAQDAADGSITLAAPSPQVVRAAPRVLGIWQRAGLHVVSALRLRRKLAAHKLVRGALLTPSGKIEDVSAEMGGSIRAALVRAVCSMEKARSAAVRSAPEKALTLWQGLVDGEWSLVDHWEHSGRRYIAAYRNRPGVRDPRALGVTERTVAKMLSLGAANKEIAYSLGLPSGTVAACVSQILKKLRLKTRAQIAAIFSATTYERFALTFDERELRVVTVTPQNDRLPRGCLTDVELHVATCAARGWSNARIAEERAVSPHTIAKQLRRIYDKLEVSNRSQLARLLVTSESSTTSPR